MLQKLIEGQRDPVVLADLAVRRLRNKTPALVEALTGRFRDYHAFLARMHLNLIDQHTAAIAELTERIEVVIEPFRGFHQQFNDCWSDLQAANDKFAKIPHSAHTERSLFRTRLFHVVEWLLWSQKDGFTVDIAF